MMVALSTHAERPTAGDVGPLSTSAKHEDKSESEGLTCKTASDSRVFSSVVLAVAWPGECQLCLMKTLRLTSRMALEPT